jgi:hypothetical protein
MADTTKIKSEVERIVDQYIFRLSQIMMRRSQEDFNIVLDEMKKKIDEKIQEAADEKVVTISPDNIKVVPAFWRRNFDYGIGK